VVSNQSAKERVLERSPPSSASPAGWNNVSITVDASGCIWQLAGSMPIGPFTTPFDDPVLWVNLGLRVTQIRAPGRWAKLDP